MDKYRRAVIELCVALELAKEGKEEDKRIIDKLVEGIKSSFNHNDQFRYEQHLEREQERRIIRDAGGTA